MLVWTGRDRPQIVSVDRAAQATDGSVGRAAQATDGNVALANYVLHI